MAVPGMQPEACAPRTPDPEPQCDEASALGEPTFGFPCFAEAPLPLPFPDEDSSDRPYEPPVWDSSWLATWRGPMRTGRTGTRQERSPRMIRPSLHP
jgi:hypothetical protein